MASLSRSNVFGTYLRMKFEKKKTVSLIWIAARIRTATSTFSVGRTGFARSLVCIHITVIILLLKVDKLDEVSVGNARRVIVPDY